MNRDRTIRHLLAGILCLGWQAMAQAQEATPLAPQDGATDPAQTQTETATPADSNPVSALPADRQSCKRVLVVDEEPRDWSKLEIGADVAWEAYRKGDYATSVPVFARLAKIGHPVAEWLMGHVYFQGQGVPLNQARALEWFEKAANQGCFPAYAPTAQMHERGEGTPIDLGRAYAWYNIAVAQLPDSKARDDMIAWREAVAARMSPAQVEAAQKRSNQFKATPIVPPDPEDLPVDYFKP